MSDPFVVNAILTRLAALTAEAAGARRAKDPEHIHRMRVAARRLRTALGLFDEAASPRWNKRIRKLARALSTARDSDVQIALVHTALAHAPEPRHRPGLRRLLLRLKQRRTELQTDVIKALDKFEQSGLAADMTQALAAAAGQADSAALRARAHQSIAALVQDVLDFDPAVRDPGRIDDLHQLRIAFKHLRYTLEIFAPLFPTAEAAEGASELEPGIKLVKTFQEILGDIHDCDVWTAYLPQFLAEERERTLDYFGHARSLKTLEPGLHYLAQERQYHRGVRYNEFMDLWLAHLEAGTWPALTALTGPAAEPAADNRPAAAVIALLSDIHGNLPALEAVVAHARERGAQQFWNVGDLVGYGPFPDEVVQYLKHHNILSLIGNYDQKVLQVKQKKDKWRKIKRSAKLLAFEWAYDHLSAESRQYLRRLPAEQRLTLNGRRILLVHGTPESNEEGLAPDTPVRRLREIAASANADLIIAGHSHQPFSTQVDGVWFINPGSVGRPDDGDPRAAYALLSLGPESFEVQHHRVEYDTARVAAAIKDYGLPESFARIFVHGRSLDDLVIDE